MVRALTIALMLPALVGLLLAQDGPAPPVGPAVNLGADWEITPASKKAVERGLEWLARNQKPDGSYGAQSGYGSNAGITGLAGLAFLADGSVPGRGKYCVNVEKCLDFVLANTSDSSGLIASEVSHGPMYGHGFATLFLAEVYGMTGRPDVREKLRLAVRLIVNTQNYQGGWRYMPIPADADLSVTICQTMALRAARNAGIKVPKRTIDKAIDYVRKSQNSDGGFSYTLSKSGGMGGSAFPRSAAGVASLYYSGVYTGKEIESGLGYLLKQKPGGGGRSAMMGGHFFYGQYYAVQAFFLAGGDYWRQWFPAIREHLVRTQNGEGAWTQDVGPEFSTAMALIILQVPNRYLPILER